MSPEAAVIPEMSPEAAVTPEMSPEAAVTPETRLLEAAVTIPTRAENPWRMTAAREKLDAFKRMITP